MSGRPLDGRYRTNATFLRGGTTSLFPTHIYAWSYLPGWKRSAVRQSGLAAVVAALWALVSGHRDGLVRTFLGTLAVVLVWTVWLSVERHRVREHVRTYVQPLHATLSAYLKLPPTVKHPDYLDVPLTFATNEETPATAKLPMEWLATEANKKVVAELALAKLGQSELEAEFRTVGVPTLVIRQAPEPPATVLWTDLAADIAACRPGEVVIGMAARNKVFKASLNTEEPHWGFSCNTGRGKSTMLMASAAQLLAQDPGATVQAVDPKMTSLEPLIGVPGFTVANDPQDVQGMWDSIAGFRRLMDDRIQQRAEDPTVEFPIAVLMVDELNQFAEQSSTYWQAIKQPTDRKTPPMWADIAAVAWQGRQFRCHLILVGQRLDARATGGMGLRDSLGLRGLSGFRPQQWKMLVGTAPIPVSQRPRGRWIYTDGQSETWVQNVLATSEQIRDHVMRARRPMSQVNLSAQVSGHMGHQVGQVEWVVGLEAAAARAGLSVEAFRKRRQRGGGELAGESRQGNQPAFPADVLDALRADA